MAFDKNGNFDVQTTGEYELSTGEKVELTGTNSIFPGMNDIAESRDYFSGLGIFGGINLMFAGEGDETHPVGLSLSLGIGEGLEGHFYGTNTWSLFEWRNDGTCIE